MTNTVIYVLHSSRNGEVRYVGQTTQKPSIRLRQHIAYAKYKITALQLWMFREINDGHIVGMTILRSDAIFNETERLVIAEYRNAGARLLNHTEGGEGVLGHSPSAETRQKRSDSVKRNWERQSIRVRWKATDEQRKKISDAKKTHKPVMLGKRHSEETKKKMREWAALNKDFLCARNVGRKHSPETRERMSAARSAYWAAKREAQHV